MSFPGVSEAKESAFNAEDPDLTPGMGRFPWRREWLPTLVFLLGKSHGQRSLAGYSPWGHKSQTRVSNQTTTTTGLAPEFILVCIFK